AYSLNHFRLNAEYASNEDVYNLDLGSRRNLRYHLNKILPFRYKCFIRENKLFDPRLLNLKIANKVYLDGYWQDENYFKDIEAIIRKDFEIISPHDHINIELAKKMSKTNAICLHARRLKYEYLLSAEYYDLAIKHIAKKVPNPHFYCFSDDIEWIKNNITMNYPVTYISHNEESKDYDDLWLMTQCKHYIIANSTFSWWGAWLNPDSSKIIIAPKNWGYRAAVPKDWIVL
ncbi:MAG: alpha-1,2-fucosyltransferase, partial [Candidatus Thermoplasmatota archaeon]|nr:alpha-1,2-fucosyltransferase [Candidatus Thermoplasmatota archaeon]